uniref:NADH dehydrogenase subunit 1 n=1 Tax=Daphnia tibetana TaxID=2172416 RepID=UPI002115455F|nr:NADH dehydrogenase subunit 1 [Daphnia tibetana]USH58536.1 NADH dehydrogenase subunit 1 [Daphnia tibetana]
MQLMTLLILMISVLVGVAFFTLFERKLLGYIQLRKGPNKVGVGGIIQPFADAIKLFSKEHLPPSYSNYAPFLAAPCFSLGLALMVWASTPSSFNFMSFNMSILFFLCCVSMGVYSLLAAGWSSNSKYSMFGALRGVAQTISYEVSLVLIIFTPLIVTFSYEMSSFTQFQSSLWFGVLFPLNCLVLLISCLAETNRTPFDFAEGESELVSGYNTEYSSGGFALIMLAEYTSILFMSFLVSFLFFGGGGLLFIKLSCIAFAFVWVRGTLPRFRYDKLMSLAWKSFLPFSLLFLVGVGGVLTVM